MHEKTLPKGSVELLNKLKELNDPLLNSFVLAGGTGLALQLGHRISIDFDFFKTESFDINKLHRILKKISNYEVLQEDNNTLTILINKIKISYFRIDDPFIFDTIPYRFFSVADKRDIALMKLLAISGRGSRKDFADLYTILRSGPTLRDYFELLTKKYTSGRANIYHILKSLTFFEDAEKEPMPEMLEPFDWKECKNFFIREAHAIVLK